MGVLSDIKKMSKDYIKDPHAQYFTNLDKLLKIGRDQGLSQAEILDHVKSYFGYRF